MKKTLLILLTFGVAIGTFAQTNNVANPTTNHTNITTGSNNTSLGVKADSALTTGEGNVAIGFKAMYFNRTKNGNVAVGNFAGGFNDGNDNIFLGSYSGTFNEGKRNVLIGNYAGYDKNEGDDNVMIGDEAGYENDKGENNIFIGREAGKESDDGNNNVFVGKSSGEINKDGENNTFLGYRSGAGSEDAERNVAIGDSAGASLMGTKNVAIGSLAGLGSENANNNVFIGANARAEGADVATLSNVAAIGDNAMVTVENAIVLGDTTNPDIKIGIGTAAPRHRLDVKGVINMRVAYNAPGLNVNDNEFIGIDKSGRVTLADFRMKYKSENDWADYVFAKDYSLMPLQDLEKFILVNKHLPNVPSAKEVVEEGVNMNQITTKLLEKIEEQTLYIIDLQKQIDELKNLMTQK